MKLIDVLNKLGINLDKEVDYTEKKTYETNGESNNDNEVGNEKEKENQKEKDKDKDKDKDKEEESVEIVFDDKTGLFDTEKIKDEAIKGVLEKANTYTINKANQVKIDKAIDDKLGSLKIRKGITFDAVKSLLKVDNIKINGDKVTGLEEAFENLQKEQSGLFVQRQTGESNPMLEGFNPVQGDKNSTDVLGAGIAALSESLNGYNN